MAEIAFDPTVLTELLFTLGGSDFSQAVSSCKFTPNSQLQTFKGGKTNVNKAGRPNYTLALTVGQDWDSATSLVNYLAEHAGEEQPATYQLNGGATVSATVVIVAPELGGDVDALLTSTLSLGVNGVPTVTPPAG